jgi:putative transposase
MGSKGDCYDNAVCEAFHATLEKELLPRAILPHPTGSADRGVRLHRGVLQPRAADSTLGYRSPDEYERDPERSDCLPEEETTFIEEQAKAA